MGVDHDPALEVSWKRCEAVYGRRGRWIQVVAASRELSNVVHATIAKKACTRYALESTTYTCIGVFVLCPKGVFPC